MTSIQAIIFDKDGTLFDFEATWSSWARSLLLDLSAGDTARAEVLGEAIGFDFARSRFEDGSLVIAGTPGEIAEALLPHVPGASPLTLVARMNALAAVAPQAEAVPLAPLLGALRGQGLRLGVATNDAEGPARAHLEGAGVLTMFDFIAGFDSGHGAKPAPGQLLAFAEQMGLRPAQVAMVGDSRHDLHAARAAGMAAVAVLSGIADRAELQPHADVVLPDIGHLPDWLGTRQGAAQAAETAA